MKQVKPAALAAFRELLGPVGYTDDADLIAPWLTDWRGLYQGQAPAMLSPASTMDVVAAMRIARDYGVPLVPQGGNTSMVGGATPPADGRAVILSLRRMTQIRSVDPAANLAVAEAGVILQTLHDAALAQHRRFPLTLAAKGSATIGGLVSTNAGGTQVLRFGTMRALTLGVEAVLPDGSIHDGLSPLKKDTRGYDLTQLLVGAEGTLGIITAAALRLVPAADARCVAWIGLDSPQTALRLLRLLETLSGEALESFELVPDSSLQAVLRHIPGTRAPLSGHHLWHVLIEAVGEGDIAVQVEGWLAQAAASDLIADAVMAASETQAEALWKLRESVSAAERASGPAIQHDISVAVDAMPDFMVEAARLVEDAYPGVHASAFGHLGDGNVHFHVRAPDDADEASWRAGQGKSASQMVYDLVTAAHGSISAEHGIGQMKRDELARLSSPARLHTLVAIKQAMDPAGLLNPEKLVPLAFDRPDA
jgi:FAD/FMN-containing dehydrogenase